MAQGTIYLKETTRSGSVLWETVACEACMAVHRGITRRPGDQRIERPWRGELRECGFCEASEEADHVR